MYRTAEVTSHDGADLSSVDATVAFWVSVSTWEDRFERVLLEAVLGWLLDDWSLERPVIMTNEMLDHQIATIESLGLTRRFDYGREQGHVHVPRLRVMPYLREEPLEILIRPSPRGAKSALTHGNPQSDRQPVGQTPTERALRNPARGDEPAPQIGPYAVLGNRAVASAPDRPGSGSGEPRQRRLGWSGQSRVLERA